MHKQLGGVFTTQRKDSVPRLSLRTLKQERHFRIPSSLVLKVMGTIVFVDSSKLPEEQWCGPAFHEGSQHPGEGPLCSAMFTPKVLSNVEDFHKVFLSVSTE